MYKILSLDGGGCWALNEVRALQAIFGADAKGRDVLSEFDLVVATSGGGSTLGGLLEDQPLSTVLTYFTDRQRRMMTFKPTSNLCYRILTTLAGRGPKFSSRRKLSGFQEMLVTTGSRTLPEVAAGIPNTRTGKPVHLVVTSFDYDRNLARFFRSTPIRGTEWGVGSVSPVTVAQALHASTNAPVICYDAPASWNDGQSRFWDGAISGYNNPVLAGVIEAITLDVPPTEIRALSLGSGTIRRPGVPSKRPPPFKATRSRTGLARDIIKLAGAIMDDPPDTASFVAHAVTGGRLSPAHPSRVVRMNPMVCPIPDGAGGWRAPGDWSVKRWQGLASIDVASVKQKDVDEISAYADLWLAGAPVNQPIRMDTETLEPEIGQRTFGEALEAWRAIT